jgi:CubicO group peptidase (beta-lactamase class C family)
MRGPIADDGVTRREFLSIAAGAASLGLAPRALARREAAGAETEADLDDFVRRQMRAGRLPGLGAAIVMDGEIAWARGYGLANIPRDVPAGPDVEFMLASVSKTVTAVAAMQAVEDGVLDLDTDVNDVLPFAVRNPRFPDDAITLRMLLTHTASLRDNWQVLTEIYTPGDSPVPLGAFLAEYFVPGGRHYDAERNFLVSAPGTDYRYCNEGVALAALLVEAAAGVGFDARCEERIFAPLGMDQTSWHLAGLERRDVAMPYRYVRSAERYRRYGQYGYPDYPDGQLRTSARQLARFLLAFIGLGEFAGVRILQEATVREMRRSQVPDVVPGQGLVWYVWHRGGERLLGHNGGDSGVATQIVARDGSVVRRGRPARLIDVGSRYGTKASTVPGAPDPFALRGLPSAIQAPSGGRVPRRVRFSIVTRWARSVSEVGVNDASADGSGPNVSVPSAPVLASTPVSISQRTALRENPG